MKPLHRLGIYFLIFLGVGALTGFLFDPGLPLPNSTPGGVFGYYLGYYGSGLLITFLFCEGIYRAGRLFTPKPSPPVPDTQHLQPPDARTTAHLDIKH